MACLGGVPGPVGLFNESWFCLSAALVSFLGVLFDVAFTIRVPQVLIYQPRKGQRVGVKTLHGGSDIFYYLLQTVNLVQEREYHTRHTRSIYSKVWTIMITF
jgi:hypothetical protein